jgi:hypothetical protein
MRRIMIFAILGLGFSGAASQAAAAGCAAGVYHAGCAGPNGAVVAKRPVAPPPPHAATVNCASGAYHSGCAGPNGAVVTSHPATPHCYWSGGVKVCR